MKRLNLRRRRGGLSATVWLVIQKYFKLFFNDSNDKEKSVRWAGRAFQIEGAAWRKARLAKTVLATSTWRRIFELVRRDLGAVWKLSRSARYAGFLVVIVLYVWRAILKLIREATGSQCRSASTGVMWSRFLVPKTTRANVFMTRCNLLRFPTDVPYSKELQ